MIINLSLLPVTSNYRSFAYRINAKKLNSAEITNNKTIDDVCIIKAASITAYKPLFSYISLYGACMAVHNGFDNRFYINVWERKQDPLCKAKFQGKVIF